MEAGAAAASPAPGGDRSRGSTQHTESPSGAAQETTEIRAGAGSHRLMKAHDSAFWRVWEPAEFPLGSRKPTREGALNHGSQQYSLLTMRALLGLLENWWFKHSRVPGEGRPASSPGWPTHCLENTGASPDSLRLRLLLWGTSTKPIKGHTTGVNHLCKMLAVLPGPMYFPLIRIFVILEDTEWIKTN